MDSSTREKNDVDLKIWVPESLWRELQDLAADADTSLSEYTRQVLTQHAWGAAHKLSMKRSRQERRREPPR